MPKEIINRTTYYTMSASGEIVDAPPGTTTPMIENPRMLVHWGKPDSDLTDGPSGHVQIEFEISRSDVERRLSDHAGASHYGFFTESLSRQEINRLIRILRKARDQALGADE